LEQPHVIKAFILLYYIKFYQEAVTMALSRKSKLKEIFDNDSAYAILRKHIPSMDKDDPRMSAALGMAAQALLAFPQTKCPKEVREAFFEELEAANIG
jgi:hypothetical protein